MFLQNVCEFLYDIADILMQLYIWRAANEDEFNGETIYVVMYHYECNTSVYLMGI